LIPEGPVEGLFIDASMNGIRKFLRVADME
jgi:hypothetical protein